MLQKEFRLLSHVPRWAIVKTLRTQSLAEHQYFTAVIAWRIIEDCNLDFTPEERLLVWKEAMLHDLEEVVSGDLPGPVNACVKAHGKHVWKHWLQDRTRDFFPWYQEEASPKVKQLVKIADLTEAVLFLSEEREMGNQYIEPHITALGELLEIALEPMDQPIKDWVEATISDSLRRARVLKFVPDSTPTPPA